jgi:Arc/MetJ family transcription regulator
LRNTLLGKDGKFRLEPNMTAELAIDEKLLAEVQELSGKRTVKSAVNTVLRDYVARRRRQLDALRLSGTIDFDPDYDYKAERRRKRGGASA